jgi:hypothetical protein
MYSSLRHNLNRKLAGAMIALVATALLPLTAFAQVTDPLQLIDALRLSTQPLPSGSRGLAMGGSLISAADGLDALDFNPAAIAPLPAKELEFSLFDRNHASTASFFQTPSDATLTNFAFSSIGVATPFETTRGHFALGISYDRLYDYTASYGFSGINPTTSHFNSTQGDVKQYGTVTEEGGLNAIRIGAGIDIAPGVSAGATVNILVGQYDYSRNFSELDMGPDTGLQFYIKNGNLVNVLHQDQSGASLKLGLLVDRQIVKFGLTLETPQAIHVNETSQLSGTATYSDSIFDFNPEDNTYAQEYDIITPMKFGAGISAHLLGITAAANVVYTDMTQLRFRNIDASQESVNDDARTMLRPVLSMQFGAEYVIPVIGMSVRGGYGIEPSPYKGDPASFDTKTISGGLGLLLSKSILLEASMRHLTYHTSHNIFTSNITDDAVTRNDVALSFKYRF